ncbi:MAG: hypothetical protein GY874_14295 [Desulfobacteraceae bacterium]|nr:hypothetical protein [Desulfobacteraceae bacterium]
MCSVDNSSIVNDALDYSSDQKDIKTRVDSYVKYLKSVPSNPAPKANPGLYKKVCTHLENNPYLRKIVFSKLSNNEQPELKGNIKQSEFTTHGTNPEIKTQINKEIELYDKIKGKLAADKNISDDDITKKIPVFMQITDNKERFSLIDGIKKDFPIMAEVVEKPQNQIEPANKKLDTFDELSADFGDIVIVTPGDQYQNSQKPENVEKQNEESAKSRNSEDPKLEAKDSEVNKSNTKNNKASAKKGRTELPEKETKLTDEANKKKMMGDLNVNNEEEFTEEDKALLKELKEPEPTAAEIDEDLAKEMAKLNAKDEEEFTEEDKALLKELKEPEPPLTEKQEVATLEAKLKAKDEQPPTKHVHHANEPKATNPKQIIDELNKRINNNNFKRALGKKYLSLSREANSTKDKNNKKILKKAKEIITEYKTKYKSIDKKGFQKYLSSPNVEDNNDKAIAKKRLEEWLEDQ